ncbi:MAG: GGDEF domain-containing protein [Lachnospiraceae bacterium]|nr:GGDEF domain-containing protein [Lachnospiraceae bacterium]
MAYFSTGKATIGKELQLIKADKEFYGFIGYENPLYLEQSVYKADWPKVKAAIMEAFATGGQTMEAYRTIFPDGSVQWVVADIRRKEYGTAEQVVELNIQSIEELEQDFCRLGDTIQEYGVYLDILDELFFRYDIEKDSLTLFIGGEKQRMDLYSGSLNGWEEALIQKGAFGDGDKYREVFDEMCNDLQQGTRHFSHELQLPNLIHGDSKELYLFKGKTIADSAGELRVFGCVYSIAKNSRRKKTALGADTARDEMTGLLTKQTIVDYIQKSMINKTSKLSYLCVMDVDNFKYVNDNFGHMFGDKVLITVADIIKDAVEDCGVAGRIGGDEMMIFIENVADRAELKSVLRTIRTNVEWAYKGVRDDLHLSCSMGAAAWPKDADNYDDLFKIADKMLYRAKENGKNRYIIYTPEIHGNPLENTVADVPVVKNNTMGTNKEHFILELTEQFLLKSIFTVQMTIDCAGPMFDLAQVNVLYEEPVYKPMHWRADGAAYKEFDISFMHTTKFRALFNEDHLAVINHTVDLEFSCPRAYEVLKAHNVNAALIYEMNHKVPGYVLFLKEGHSSRLWSESDKVYLNLIAKMIDLVIGGK